MSLRPSQLPTDARHELLAAMGVSVWYERPRRAPSSNDAQSRQSVDAAPGYETRLSDSLPTLQQTAPRQIAPSLPLARDSGAPIIEPFEIYCVAGPQALLLAPPLTIKKQRRIVSEVVLSAGIARRIRDGESTPKARSIQFRYPLVGAVDHGTEEGAQRALRAFVSAQLERIDRPLVLMVASIGHRFTWLEAPAITIPEVDVLLADAEAKRALWAELSAL